MRRDPRNALAAAARGPLVLQQATVPAAMLLDRSLAGGQDTARVDIGLRDGQIAFVHAAGADLPSGWTGISLFGGMVWPCFVDAHAHLDSAQIWSRAPNPDGSFPGAANAMFEFRDRHWTAEDMRRRMTFGLASAYAHGTQAIRTHLASQNDTVEQRWEIYRDLREEWRGRISLQASSLIGLDASCDDGLIETTASIVKTSGGVLGAFAPMAPNIDARLHRMFAAAERHGLALDFHADETADPKSRVLMAIARVALERKFQGPILVGHCCSLSAQEPALVDRTLDLVAEARINIVSLPSSNLYLQGRRPGKTPLWRGVTLLHEMRARGIAVCLGCDNCRDAFCPYGDYDMAEVFRDAVRIGHLDHPIGDWPAAVSRVPAAVMGEPDPAIGAGRAANLVLLTGRSFNEMLARPTAPRILIRDGRLVEPTLPDFSDLDLEGTPA